MAFKTKHLLLYMILVTLALNTILLGAYEKGTLFNFELNDENRIFFHLATIVLFIFAYVSNKRNMHNSKKETLDLIADLENNNS